MRWTTSHSWSSDLTRTCPCALDGRRASLVCHRTAHRRKSDGSLAVAPDLPGIVSYRAEFFALEGGVLIVRESPTLTRKEGMLIARGAGGAEGSSHSQDSTQLTASRHSNEGPAHTSTSRVSGTTRAAAFAFLPEEIFTTYNLHLEGRVVFSASKRDTQSSTPR